LTIQWFDAILSALNQGVIAGVVQLVERFLAKEKVVGSSPIARSLKSIDLKTNYLDNRRRGQVARQGSAKA
jgi:hypothetical protein